MISRLLFLFIAVPLVELYILMKLGSYIGVEYTVLIVVVTGMVGAFLAKRQGLSTLRRISEDLNGGRLPAEGLLDGLLILIGGAMLITPGLITDAAGLSLIVPVTRTALKVWLRRKFEQKLRSGELRIEANFSHVHRDDDDLCRG